MNSLRYISIPIADRWKHVYRCYEADLKKRYRFAMFCFKCSEWITSEADWELHCQGHIDRFDTPLRCDPITFRYALACAGHCPRCLRKSERPAAERMYQFTNRARWLQHVQKCMQEDIQSIDRNKAILCPYGPPCSMLLESDLHVWPHLQDYHAIDMPNAGRKRRFDSKSETDTSTVKSDTDRPKRPRLQGKRYIKSEPLSGTFNYDFINHSAADLDSSSSDTTKSPTTASTRSSCETTRYSSPASSIEYSSAYGRSSPPVCIDPQLLPQPNVPLIRDESLCSSVSSISLSSAMASPDTCSPTSAHTGAEHYMGLDKEEAYPSRNSIEDIAPTQSTLE